MEGRPHKSGIAVTHPYADGRVECKDGLNASRALLVLEHIIIKDRVPPYSLVLQSPTPTPMVGLGARMA